MSRIRKAKTVTRAKWFQNLIPTLTMVLPIVAMVCLIAVVVNRYTDKKKALSSAESTPQVVWELPPPPRPFGVPNLPAIPQLPEMRNSQEANAVAGYDSESLSLKLKALIQNHPLRIVRERLHQSLSAKKIVLNWQPAQGLYAQFQVIPSGEVHMPILSIDPNWLASVKTSDQIYLAFLVIFHESVHFEQYETGDEKIKLFFASSRIAESQLQITREEICRQMWLTELDAYTQECRVANQWGYPLMETFCLYVDSAFWSHVIFNRLYNDVYLEEKVKRVCGPIFATLAGHPYPQRF